MLVGVVSLVTPTAVEAVGRFTLEGGGGASWPSVWLGGAVGGIEAHRFRRDFVVAGWGPITTPKRVGRCLGYSSWLSCGTCKNRLQRGMPWLSEQGLPCGAAEFGARTAASAGPVPLYL